MHVFDGGRSHEQTRGEHRKVRVLTQVPLNARRADLDSNSGPSCCEATVLTTKPPCSPRWYPTAKENKSEGVGEGDKTWAQLTGHWLSLCDLISLLLLRLEYHPLDPLTGISDSVDTVVRSVPQPECHQSTSQHTIKMIRWVTLGDLHVPAKSHLFSSHSHL